jgi:hypothetical protein
MLISLQASDVVREITGSETVNVMGYCIGGTLLSMTLALLSAKRGDGLAVILAKTRYSNPDIDQAPLHPKSGGDLDTRPTVLDNLASLGNADCGAA